jgi:hypothetical protein
MSVLLFDIVGFSKEPNNRSMMEFVDQMHTVMDNLLTPDYTWNEDGVNGDKNDFVLIPTGDGYGIAFHTKRSDQEILNITRDIYQAMAKGGSLKFRMGIAKANNIVTLDLNQNVNVFGVGIVLAARACAAARTGQILVHEYLAKSLLQANAVIELQKVPTLQVKHELEIDCYNYAGVHEGLPFGLLDDKAAGYLSSH